MSIPINHDRSFSKAMDTVKFVADIPTDIHNDVSEVWFCTKTGTFLGWYSCSGIRAITSGLAYRLLEKAGVNTR
jgi:hypothetical protein